MLGPLDPSLPIRGVLAVSEPRNISRAWKRWKSCNTAVPQAYNSLSGNVAKHSATRRRGRYLTPSTKYTLRNTNSTCCKSRLHGRLERRNGIIYTTFSGIAARDTFRQPFSVDRTPLKFFHSVPWLAPRIYGSLGWHPPQQAHLRLLQYHGSSSCQLSDDTCAAALWYPHRVHLEPKTAIVRGRGSLKRRVLVSCAHLTGMLTRDVCETSSLNPPTQWSDGSSQESPSNQIPRFEVKKKTLNIPAFGEHGHKAVSW